MSAPQADSQLAGPLLKARLLLGLARRHPIEFSDRVSAFLQVRIDRLARRRLDMASRQAARSLEETLKSLEPAIGYPVLTEASAEEVPSVAIEVARAADRRTTAPFSVTHDADASLAKLCFVLTRALKPRVVLETGVAYGVTSAFVLEALERNGEGTLHSVDLPPLCRGAERYVGTLVPERVRTHWELHTGTSRRVLPELLPRLRRVDLFIHDSLHTYANIRLELEAVAPFLASSAFVVADDVEQNLAFAQWVGRRQPVFSALVRSESKRSLIGLCAFVDRSAQLSAR